MNEKIRLYRALDGMLEQKKFSEGFLRYMCAWSIAKVMQRTMYEIPDDIHVIASGDFLTKSNIKKSTKTKDAKVSLALIMGDVLDLAENTVMPKIYSANYDCFVAIDRLRKIIDSSIYLLKVKGDDYEDIFWLHLRNVVLFNQGLI